MPSLTASPECFTCVHMNAQSVPAHIETIRSLMRDLDPHVVLISESWLKSSHSDSDFHVPGYVIVRHDRVEMRAGGVAMYIRTDLTHNIIARSSTASRDNKTVEFLAVEMIVNCTALLLYVVYKPPDVHSLTELYNSLAIVTPQYEHVILMGDFNTNLLVRSARSKRLVDNMKSYHLTVLPSGPTHHGENHESSLLDLAIVSKTDRVLHYEQRPAPGISRHYLLSLTYSFEEINTPMCH
ncbi:uncharacterized protein LOC103514603 [Diaphorina citri]|uniref:Uncharacterized protein LOC103514603 n=1 Tax=Diaphorina citri TaxID=121845 RepID=A0A3Q0J4B2_DIACI|nr:uncharacterized protein LOC103514603 [Diaphorina citri]